MTQNEPTSSSPDLAALLVGSVFMAWVLATLAASHTDHGLSRIRHWDRTGLLIPDWRFFAPNPSVHDLHLLYRVRDAAGHTSAWQEALPIPIRRWSQTFWFPARRSSKAIFDTVTSMEMTVGRTPRDPRWMTDAPAYRTLAHMVEAEIRATNRERPELVGYQFALLRTSGHDGDAEPEYVFTSAFTPLFRDAAGAPKSERLLTQVTGVIR